jgi:hypothetical protein
VPKRGLCGRQPQSEDKIMRKALIAAALVVAIAASGAPTPVHARDGGVAAGIIGGLAVGTMLGAAVAQPRYYGPPPVYVEEAPPRCYWSRGDAVWDPYAGVWRHRRVRVCD